MSIEDSSAADRGSVLSDQLGLLPEAPIIGVSRFGSVFRGYSADHMRAYARREVAAERERLALWLESQHGDRTQREHAAKLAALMRRA